MSLCDDDRAIEMTGCYLEAVVKEFIAIVIVSRLTQRPVDEASLDEAVKVRGKAIAMVQKFFGGQRREVEFVVANNPAIGIPAPSLRIYRSIALDTASFRLTHLSFILGLCHDLLADTDCGFPCVLTRTTVGLIVRQGESVASPALRTLWQLSSSHGRRLHRDVVAVKGFVASITVAVSLPPSRHRPSFTHITALHTACTAPSVMSVLWQCCRCMGWFKKPDGNSVQSTG